MNLVAGVWRRLPAIPRAVVAGSFVTGMGTMPWSILSTANFDLFPSVPWAAPVMAVYLWLYWRYLGGEGTPRGTSGFRRRSLRARPLPSRVWRWALAAGGAGVAALLALRLAVDIAFDLPNPSADVTGYSWLTLASYVVMTSLVSGVAEEAGFRGYMQGPIEAERGPVAAIAIAGTVFWLAHLTSYAGHLGMFVGRIWFYLAASAIFGTLAYLTNSILPAVVAHSVQNALAFGLLWWSSAAPPGAGGRAPLAATLGGLVFGVAAVAAYRRLASITAPERESKTRND